MRRPKKRKKASKRKKVARRVRGPKMLGQVTHYFSKIEVAVIKLNSSLKVGDYIKFQTKEGEFVQIVESMQVNHKDIMGARKGSEIGLKTIQPVKEGNKVFKAEAPKPLIIEEKIEYTPLFSMKPSSYAKASEDRPSRPSSPPIPRKTIPQKGFSHPLIKDRTSRPARPHSESQPPQSQKKPSGYKEVKFLKF